MQSSWRVFSVFGIDIYLHMSFLLFLVILAIFDFSLLPFLFILFSVICLHEISHSLVAKAHRVKVSRILLLPIGGMAVMQESKHTPFTEFLIAIAGPLFNVVLCALIFLFFGGHIIGWNAWNSLVAGSPNFLLFNVFVSTVFWASWLLGAFNLFVPAIPLDGGRVLRSILAMFMSYLTATRVAATVSTVVTFFLFIYAMLSFNFILILISVFVYFGATSELELALVNHLLGFVPLERLVRRKFLLLKHDMSLSDVATEMLSWRCPGAFLLKDGKVLSISLNGLKAVSRKKWNTTLFSSVAQEIEPLKVQCPASDALKHMRVNGVDVLPVAEGNRLIGAVFREEIETVFQILKTASD